MFRSMLPRTSPRSALRAAAPQPAFSSSVVVPPTTFLRTSKRGYAAEAGMSLVGTLVDGSEAALWRRLR